MHKKLKIGLAAMTAAAVLTVGGIVGYASQWREKAIKLDPEYNELFTQGELDKKGHISLVSEYTTDISIGFNNADGTRSLYVYASPIRYINRNGQYSLIDTRLANVKEAALREQGYLYTIADSDIRPYYPGELTRDTGICISGSAVAYELGTYSAGGRPWYRRKKNFIGEKKDMLVYKNAAADHTELRLYPTSLGSNAELVFQKRPEDNRVSFWLAIEDSSVILSREPGGYLVMKKTVTGADGQKKNEIVGVIQKPLLKSASGEISEQCTVEFSKGADGRSYEIIFVLDQSRLDKGSTAFFSLEMRREKQPDNALYSKLPNLEYAYLRNYSVIGNSGEYGLGRLMIRYKFTKLLGLDAARILDAKYYTYSLTGNRDSLEMLTVLEDWCSLTGNWSKQYETGDRTSLLEQIRPELCFDITEEVRKWCLDSDGQAEHNGVLLKSVTEQEGVANILLSNDNTLYPVRTEVTLLP